MYSVNRIDEQDFHAGDSKSMPKPAAPHQDLSPELREVMHLLQMIETGKDKKPS
jgi:hypothetical protein